MNVELLWKVKDHILEKPERFMMEVVAYHGEPGSIIEEGHSRRLPECGTVGCIAGWTCVLSNEATAPSGKRAAQLLDLTVEEADRLFYGPNSSDFDDHALYNRFQNIWGGAGNEAEAQIVAERIDHFIATEGRE